MSSPAIYSLRTYWGWGARLGLALLCLPGVLAAGCLRVGSQALDRPLAMTYAAAGPRAWSWPAAASLALVAGCAGLGVAWWRLRRLGRRRARPLDREDLALLRTARDALAMLRRRHRGGGRSRP